MARAVRVRFRIGKYAGETEDTTRGAEILSQAVVDAGLATALRSTQARLPRLQATLHRRIKATYVRAIQYAVTHMIGRQSPSISGINFGFFEGTNTYRERVFGMSTSPGSQTPFSPYILGPALLGSVHWRGLSQRTIQEKKHRRFYVRTGRLQNYLRQRASSIVDRTGVVSVSLRQSGKDIPYNPNRWKNRPQAVPIGDISITLMPRIPMNYLPALQSGDLGDHDRTAQFERHIVGTAPATLQKLIGHPNPAFHRPLLQPVFAYFTRSRIPRQIAAAINAALIEVRNDGTAEYLELNR